MLTWVNKTNDEENNYVRVCDTYPIRINSLWFTTLKTRALDYKKNIKKNMKTAQILDRNRKK